MYKVMLVDDERLIREGIASMINWSELNLDLVGTCVDGREAYTQIAEQQPDIVITDIKMPKMDGLQLIEQVKRLYPDTRFVVLSGYGEFEFASKAMKYGVRHYLLKPCSRAEIVQVLSEIKVELYEDKQKAEFLGEMEHRLQNMIPQLKEQFLRDCILNNQKFSRMELDYYKNVLNIGDEQVILVLMQPEGQFDYLELFALKNISEDLFATGSIILSTNIGKRFLMLIQDMKEEALKERIRSVNDVFSQYYKLGLTVSFSNPGTAEQLSMLYRDVVECLKYRFYLGEGCIITERDVRDMEEGYRELALLSEVDFDKITMAVKVGNLQEMEGELAFFFEKLNEVHPQIEFAVSYCIELFAAITRQRNEHSPVQSAKERAAILSKDTLEDIQRDIVQVAREITSDNYERNARRHSRLVNQMLQLVKEQLHNEHFSLAWISKEVFFMDTDYIGKLFKKETGEKFSHYLMKARMEQATNLIDHSDDFKIYEIALQTGFGENYPYFSQMFKKQFGCTPTEYRKRR
jgi:two-component system response regulator YesN